MDYDDVANVEKLTAVLEFQKLSDIHIHRQTTAFTLGDMDHEFKLFKVSSCLLRDG